MCGVGFNSLECAGQAALAQEALAAFSFALTRRPFRSRNATKERLAAIGAQAIVPVLGVGVPVAVFASVRTSGSFL